MFLKQLALFSLVVASGSSYEINTFFERILLTNYNWRTCCNDQFLQDSVLSIVSYYRAQCINEFPTNKDCALFCIITKYKEYDTIYGFNEDVIRTLIGSRGVFTNGRWDDWKVPLADILVSNCLKQVQIVPSDDTLICNPDISKFSNCYWDGMIAACPAHLKNATNC